MNSDELAQTLAELSGPAQTRFAVNVVILRMGSGFLGTGEVAGIVFRGNVQPTRERAARDLMMQLTQGNNLDAGLGLDLAAAGRSAGDLDEMVRGAISTDGGSGRARALDSGNGEGDDAEAEFVDVPEELHADRCTCEKCRQRPPYGPVVLPTTRKVPR